MQEYMIQANTAANDIKAAIAEYVVICFEVIFTLSTKNVRILSIELIENVLSPSVATTVVAYTVLKSESMYSHWSSLF